MIRHLTADEPYLCIEGGREFFQEGKLPGGFKPDVFKETWSRLIESRVGTLIGWFEEESIRGALGAVISPDLNNGDLVGIECFWFIRPEFRGGLGAVKLLKEFESWARRRGAKRVAMIHLLSLQPTKLGELYEKLGYREVERNYLREF